MAAHRSRGQRRALNPQRIAVLQVAGNWLYKSTMNDAPGNLTLNTGVSPGVTWGWQIHARCVSRRRY
jgi:hypothetical protein